MAHTVGQHEKVVGAAAIFHKVAASHWETGAVSSTIGLFPFAIIGSCAGRFIKLTAFDSAHTLLTSLLSHTLDRKEKVVGVVAIRHTIAASHRETGAISTTIGFFLFTIVRSGAGRFIKLTTLDSAHTVLTSSLALAQDHGVNVAFGEAILFDATGSIRETVSICAAITVGVGAIGGGFALVRRVALHETPSVFAIHLTRAGNGRKDIALGIAIFDVGASTHRFADPIPGAVHLFRSLLTIGIGYAFSRSDNAVSFLGGNLGAVDAAFAIFAKFSSHAEGQCVKVSRIVAVRYVHACAHLEAYFGHGATVHIFGAVLDCRTRHSH